jgi:hypothetical protein
VSNLLASKVPEKNFKVYSSERFAWLSSLNINLSIYQGNLTYDKNDISNEWERGLFFFNPLGWLTKIWKNIESWVPASHTQK